MLIVPLLVAPVQTLQITLAEQACRIRLRHRATGLFMDLYVAGVLVVGGVLCHNLNLIVRSEYLGFAGDFTFIDNAGTHDPEYTGLGTRYSLAYMEATDLE